VVYGASAERLLKYALKNGYDEMDGGVFNRVYPDGSIDRHNYFWQQAEGLRALMVAASEGNRSDLWRRYDQTRQLIEEEIVDTEHGGWRVAVKEICDVRRCGDEQPDPYHMIGMHVTAINLSKAK
jgi:mannose/cellobiose epimerase-like protein (N-acyl-D-glucosamine 2-epimerase family)